MKKLLKIIGVLAGVAMLAFVGLVALVVVSFAGTSKLLDGFEPVPGVRTIKEKFVSSYMVEIRRGKVLLIDAGMDRKAEPIMKALASWGLKPDAVEAILLTHGHSDHTGGVLAFPKARVYALEADVPLVEGKAGSNSFMGRLAGVRDTGIRAVQALRDGQVLDVGGLKVKVFAVPGHTKGSAAYLARGVLFMGDSADSLKKGGIAGAKWMFSESQKINHESLKALAARVKTAGVRAMVFAHSGALAGIKALEDFAAAH